MISFNKHAFIVGLLLSLSCINSHAERMSKTWEAMGPGGLSLGNDYDFKMSLSPPNTLYLRTGNTLLKSINGSEHWSIVDREHGETFSSMLLIDPVNPQVLFTMLLPKANLSYLLPRLARSLDGGMHWDDYDMPDFSAPPDSFFRLSHSELPLLAFQSGDRTTVATSSDGGENWQDITSSMNSKISIMAIDPHNPNQLYGRSYQNSQSSYTLHKSIDCGKSWLDMVHTKDIFFNKLQVHPADSELLFATLSESKNPSFEFIVRSQNSGKDWVVMETPDKKYIFDNILLSGTDIDTLYATIYLPNQGSSEIVFAKSTDGGDNWRVKSTGFFSHNNTLKPTLIVHPQNSQILFLATATHGIIHSKNGGQDWQSGNSGIKQIGGQLAVAKTAPSIMYLASEVGYYQSVDAGVNWTKFSINDLNEPCKNFNINPVLSTEVLCSTAKKLYKSTDSGVNWGLITEFNAINSVSYSSDGKIMYLNHADGVSNSTNRGETWTKINIRDEKAYTVEWLATDPVNPNISYVLIRKPLVEKPVALYKSVNKGVSWEKKIEAHFLQVAIDPSHTERLLHWSGGGYSEISLSENGGDSWALLATPPSTRGNMGISFNPENSNGLFLLNEEGVFETKNLGKSWGLMQKNVSGTLQTSSANVYIVSSRNILKLNTLSLSLGSKNCIFEWAEQQYPQLFKPATEQSHVLGAYTYRYYSKTNTYLGFFQDKEIHLLQPSLSNEIKEVGFIEDYQNLANCH